MSTRCRRGETVEQAKARNAKRQADWRKNNRAHHLEYRKQQRVIHRERDTEYKRRTRAKNPEKWKALDAARGRQYRHKLGDAYRQKINERNRKAKEEFIAAYGGKCSCCGETRFEFLTAEHIGGRPSNQPIKSFTGQRMYRLLKRLGWPKDDYCCLCWNCNQSKGSYGYCPHEREREKC